MHARTHTNARTHSHPPSSTPIHPPPPQDGTRLLHEDEKFRWEQLLELPSTPLLKPFKKPEGPDLLGELQELSQLRQKQKENVRARKVRGLRSRRS